jgi:hypothetical protein
LSFNFTLFVASVNSLRRHNHTGRTPLPEIQDFNKVLAKRRRQLKNWEVSVLKRRMLISL